jgi:hypothetical protein
MTTPTDGEWISAQEALDSLGLGFPNGPRAICWHVGAELVKAKARRFLVHGVPGDDHVEIPREFWLALAKNYEAPWQDWKTGYFETTFNDRRFEAFGVQFRRSDIEQISKRNNTASSPGGSSLSRPTRSTTTEGLAAPSGQSWGNSPTADITDLAALESWMAAGGNRVAAKLAARSLPMLLSDAYPPDGLSKSDGELVVSAILRAASLAQFSGFVAPNVDVLRAWPEAADAADVLATSIESPIAAGLVQAAASAVRSASSNVAADAVAFAVQAVSHAIEAMSNAVNSDRLGRVRTALWESIHSDTVDSEYIDATVFARLPLWKGRAPGWANDGWRRLQDYLPPDHSWWVWFEWYEDRLRGGWRGDQYEQVFVNLPEEEWDAGPAEANAWIRQNLPPRPDEGQQRVEAEISDIESLDAWLKGQSREVAIAIAVRAALRVTPLAVPKWRSLAPDELGKRTGGILRATTLARLAAKYPSRVNRVSAATRLAVASARAAARAAKLGAGAALAADAAEAAARAADGAEGTQAAARSAEAVDAAAHAARTAIFDRKHIASDAAWREVRADVERLENLGVSAALDLPLWSQGAPRWAVDAWASFQASLPKGEDWEVWFDWYEEHLTGGSRGEEYELVFASVPQQEWDKGPAAANAWIKEHLPKRRDTPAQSDLPEPLADLDSPFTYDWNASWRVAIVAGAQNLPFFEFSSSEEDHRQTLAACRIGAERLLRDLHEASCGNAVRSEYSKRLEYYLDDLPSAAGTGNILLANDQIVVLRAMLAQDDAVPFPFAAGLSRLIDKQTALNDFYDLVRRHEEAVAKGQWTQPFPIEEAKRFFAVVEESTPQLFEPEVGNGLRQVEHAALPAAPTAKAPPSSAIELPPGTPSAEHSRQRQLATAVRYGPCFSRARTCQSPSKAGRRPRIGSERISALFLISCAASARRPE